MRHLGTRLNRLEKELRAGDDRLLDNAQILAARTILHLVPDLKHVEPQDTDAETYREIEMLRAAAAVDEVRLGELIQDVPEQADEAPPAEHLGPDAPWYAAELAAISEPPIADVDMEAAIDAACRRLDVERTVDRLEA